MMGCKHCGNPHYDCINCPSRFETVAAPWWSEAEQRRNYERIRREMAPYVPPVKRDPDEYRPFIPMDEE